MVKGTTSTGFKFEIDERFASDYRLLEWIVVADDEEASEIEKLKAVMKISEFILSKEQKNRLFEHIKKLNDGFIPFEVAQAEISEIIAESNKLKNSISSQDA